MEYIDFTAQRLHLHNNCKRAIVDLMKEVEVEEIDLLHKENVFGAAWLIRYSMVTLRWKRFRSPR